MKKVLEYVGRGGRWCWGHKFRMAILLGVFALAAPQRVRSQFVDPCCAIISAGLSLINGALTRVIGGGLNGILGVEKNIQNFEETYVWNQAQVNQALALVGNVGRVNGKIKSLSTIGVRSATLPGPQQLEQTLLSRDPAKIPQASMEFQQVYGAIPLPTDASPQVRNVIDSSDAVAQVALKRAIAIDALADLELQAADQLNQSIQNAAPGSAPIIEAQADAWLVRAHAYTQSAMADLMRVTAADLAYASADTKMGAADTAALSQQLQNLLKRP